MPEKKSDAGKAEDVEEKGLIPGSNEIAIIDERTIRDKIYVVRGVQVMLDFELAEIYGYTTSAFNRQVKNNAAKFEGEGFMFQLTREEAEELSRCNNYISIQTKENTEALRNVQSMLSDQKSLLENQQRQLLWC